ncbi:MAG: hypothetical protein O7C59_05575 [Rickettsia endosymbiont of Ixodes persulcatus]|nr:hypothetical protein [Rickettsia endosymbiont of Ixodes persulcatus]
MPLLSLGVDITCGDDGLGELLARSVSQTPEHMSELMIAAATAAL